MLLGNYKILLFSYKFYAGHPEFYRLRALGSLQFSLEHSLDSLWRTCIKYLIVHDILVRGSITGFDILKGISLLNSLFWVFNLILFCISFYWISYVWFLNLKHPWRAADWSNGQNGKYSIFLIKNTTIALVKKQQQKALIISITLRKYGWWHN